MKHRRKKRVTILTGAGFTLQANSISTKLLTDAIRPLDICGVRIGGQLPGEYFYRLLCKHYCPDDGECPIAVVNFETIIHLLEEMYAHTVSNNVHQDQKKPVIPEFKGVKPAFLLIKDPPWTDLEKARRNCSFKTVSGFVKHCFCKFVERIQQEFSSFENDSRNVSMRSFTDDFLHKYFKNSDWIVRIYSTNYDTWLHSFNDLYDGFDSSGAFEPRKVMEDGDVWSHFNIHGCVKWDFDESTFKIVRRPNIIGLKSGTSSQFGMDREPLMYTPIITGYNKLARMKYDPYLQFYFALQKDVLQSDLLMTIGYGFGDTHLNNLLRLYKGKAVVINYLSNWVKAFNDAQENGEDFVCSPSDDDADDLFKRRIEPMDGGFDLVSTPSDFVNSKDGNTFVWWRGLSDEFYESFGDVM